MNFYFSDNSFLFSAFSRIIVIHIIMLIKNEFKNMIVIENFYRKLKKALPTFILANLSLASGSLL